MRTEALIHLLAEHVAPVPRHAARRWLRLALALGLPLSFAIMLAMLGIRPDLMHAMAAPMFWIKLLFPATIAACALLAAERLARPGVRVSKAVWIGMIAPVLALWAFALWQWSAAPEATRPALLWGKTWRTCPFSIAAIGAPVFFTALAAFKALAPTRLSLAGAAAGALAGGAGGAVYALHCPELGAPFLAVWYVAGIALTTAIGAALGPRLLRW